MEQSPRLSHAYLIAGRGASAEDRAREVVQALLCAHPGPEGQPCGKCSHCRKVLAGVHPDLILLNRQTDDKGKPRREIYVDQIRDLAATAAILPGEAEKKVYLIPEAGTLNPAAQNALLKLLEEPPPFDAFVLVTENPSLLLETVRSRCVLLTAGGEEEAPPPEARDRAERWIDLAAAGARISLISFANENGELSPAELGEFARAARGLLTDMLCGRLPDRKMPREELCRLIALMDQTEEYLRFNVSGKHILGMLSVESLAPRTRGL